MRHMEVKQAEPLQQQARALLRPFEQLQGAWLADRFERLSADIQASEQRRLFTGVWGRGPMAPALCPSNHLSVKRYWLMRTDVTHLVLGREGRQAPAGIQHHGIQRHRRKRRKS